MNKTRRNAARKRRVARRKPVPRMAFHELMGATKDFFPPGESLKWVPKLSPALANLEQAEQERTLRERQLAYLDGTRDVYQPAENRVHHEWSPQFPPKGLK